MPETQETWVQSLGQGDPWSRKGQPSPIFLTGEFHGQRSLAGYSPCLKELGATEHTRLHTHAVLDQQSRTILPTYLPNCLLFTFCGVGFPGLCSKFEFKFQTRIKAHQVSVLCTGIILTSYIMQARTWFHIFTCVLRSKPCDYRANSMCKGLFVKNVASGLLRSRDPREKQQSRWELSFIT